MILVVMLALQSGVQPSPNAPVVVKAPVATTVRSTPEKLKSSLDAWGYRIPAAS